VGLTRLYFLAAVGTLVNIITSVDPSESYHGLNIPVTVDDPGVTVDHTGSRHPALVTVVFQFAKICAEEFEWQIEIAPVILASKQVPADKVPRESVAKPITGLGLHKPVFPPTIIYSPGVKIATKIDCPLWCGLDLYPTIKCKSNIIKKISLDGHILGMCGPACEQT
jgi:hypothetical protein